ncbi:unnamed protein product [Mytilus coruscus]|uniref:Uncharacterized protein n=1 Tax=Mytilus coruscus TaxID=42192 RepID=A0A6J8BDX0_MYTCO|nr:unnamed protein product [Mytilus coruscus]
MAMDVSQRPATVSFGTEVILGRRKSRAFSISQQDTRDTETFRRQSYKYQFPNPALEADKKDFDLSEIQESDIRRHVFGKPVEEMEFVGSDNTVRRPTVSSARRSVLWSRDRRLYEDRHRQDVEEFREQPYMRHEYPTLRKHYPGTWRLASRDEIQATTDRLTSVPAPTSASMNLHKFQCFLHNVLEVEAQARNRELRSCLRRRPKTSVI